MFRRAITAALFSTSFALSFAMAFSVPAARIAVAAQPASRTAATTSDRGWLGVTISTGAPVIGVAAASPAMAAGIDAGDVIVSVGGEPVQQASSLPAMIASHQPGDTVPVSIMRDGRRIMLSVHLASLPAKAQSKPSLGARMLNQAGHPGQAWLGVEITPVGAPVIGVAAASPAMAAGIHAGDVIVSFSGEPVQQAASLPAMIASRQPGGTVPVKVLRNGRNISLSVRLGSLPATTLPVTGNVSTPPVEQKLAPEQATQMLAAGALSLSGRAATVAGVPATNGPNEAALRSAAGSGDLGAVRSLIARGTNVNAGDSWGDTALIDAAQNGHLDVAKALLADHADMSAHGISGFTALEFAAVNGHLDIVRTLLAHGAPVDEPDGSGDTALVSAIEEGHLDVAAVLLAHGANVNTKNASGATPLLLAAFFGHPRAARWLVAHGADVTARDDAFITPLMVAAALDDAPRAAALIAQGANVDATGANSKTALMVAAQCGSTDIVNLLLDHGAFVGATDSYIGDPYTALFFAANKAIAAALIAHGADVNVARPQPSGVQLGGGTALMDARTAGVAEVLIAHGARVDAQDANGFTALTEGAFSGRDGVIETLLAHGAEIDPKDSYGTTPLVTAVEQGQRAAALTLVAYGADLQSIKAALATDAKNHPRLLAMLSGDPAAVQAQARDWIAQRRLKQALAAAHTPRATLQWLQARLQSDPGIQGWRWAAIEVAARLRPAPAIPETAREHLARGVAAFKLATNPQGLQPAIDEFRQAVAAAPWWPDPYYDLAKTEEKSGDSVHAALDYADYLFAAPQAQDAEDVRSKIYQLQYVAEQNQNAANALAARQANARQIAGWLQDHYGKATLASMLACNRQGNFGVMRCSDADAKASNWYSSLSSIEVGSWQGRTLQFTVGGKNHGQVRLSFPGQTVSFCGTAGNSTDLSTVTWTNCTSHDRVWITFGTSNQNTPWFEIKQNCIPDPMAPTEDDFCSRSDYTLQ